LGDPTRFEHYNHYPVCGYCLNAWNIIYQRWVSALSPVEWLHYCRHNGCDPDVWDYINRATGWPKGFKVGRQSGKPNLTKLPPVPEYDPRVFHKRDPQDEFSSQARWRKNSDALIRKAQDYRATLRGVSPVELAEWDEPESEEPELLVDLSDPDIW
jgi:hypothetical protein